MIDARKLKLWSLGLSIASLISAISVAAMFQPISRYPTARSLVRVGLYGFVFAAIASMAFLAIQIAGSRNLSTTKKAKIASTVALIVGAIMWMISFGDRESIWLVGPGMILIVVGLVGFVACRLME